MRILIAENEKSINESLKMILERNRYTVDFVYDSSSALNYAQSSIYDVIVLDIMMPIKNGIDVLKTIRSNNINTPVLFLTEKSEASDRILSLNAGADDCLSKPFVLDEFLARIKALSRRSYFYVDSNLSFGNTTLDLNSYILKTDDKKLKLNNKEFQLLELFLKNPKKVFSSEYLIEKVWDSNSEVDIEVVWTYIGFLRRKLRQIGSNLEIKTMRGAGYLLEEIAC